MALLVLHHGVPGRRGPQQNRLRMRGPGPLKEIIPIPEGISPSWRWRPTRSTCCTGDTAVSQHPSAKQPDGTEVGCWWTLGAAKKKAGSDSNLTAFGQVPAAST
jgi:hypothetical protein